MLVVTMLNHILPGLGVVYFGTTVWKAAKGYPFRRWFF
jgi:hypothetical protein